MNDDVTGENINSNSSIQKIIHTDVNANALLNLINHHLDIDKIYLHAKDPHEAKYQLLINKLKSVVSKHRNNPKAFTEY